MKLTRFRNNRPIEINAGDIVRIEEGADKTLERDYPYSDVTIYDEKDDSTYTIRVIESKSYIKREIEKDGSLPENIARRHRTDEQIH